MTTLIVALAGGACVAALIGAIALAFRNPTGSAVEDRLDVLAGKSGMGLSDLAKKERSVLSRPLDDVPTQLEEYIQRFFNIRRLIDQADVSMDTSKFAIISIALGG